MINEIKFTEKAVEHVNQLISTKEPGTYFRISVKGGGCSGLMYDLKFDNKLEDNDKLFEDNEIKIVVDKKSLLYLAGTTLEFSGGLNGKGFIFVNPNANRTCGCGESFSL